MWLCIHPRALDSWMKDMCTQLLYFNIPYTLNDWPVPNLPATSTCLPLAFLSSHFLNLSYLCCCIGLWGHLWVCFPIAPIFQPSHPPDPLWCCSLSSLLTPFFSLCCICLEILQVLPLFHCPTIVTYKFIYQYSQLVAGFLTTQHNSRFCLLSGQFIHVDP